MQLLAETRFPFATRISEVRRLQLAAARIQFHLPSSQVAGGPTQCATCTPVHQAIFPCDRDLEITVTTSEQQNISLTRLGL